MSKFSVSIIDRLLNEIKKRGEGGTKRSTQLLKHILISGVAKAISTLSPLLIVPLTIDYVNPVQYGIWLTLSSIISWMSILDLGLGNGFRNKYAEAVANNDFILARKYVSTVYVSIAAFMIIFFCLFAVFNHFIDWSSVLKVDVSYSVELRKSLLVLVAFFCAGMIVNLYTTLLNADQKSGYAALIKSAGDVFSLIAILVLSKVSDGNLYNLALYYSGVPFLTTLFISIFGFYSKYRFVSPSIKYFDSRLIKNIVGLGLQFFFINISIILIFQLINLALSREVGPEAVTQFNVAQRYFSILIAIITVISIPFWSPFTDAYVKSDYSWMKNAVLKLERFWILVVILAFLLLIISPWFYKIWIGDSVTVPSVLSFLMMLFYLLNGIETIYITLINGIGKIRIQLYLYSFFAVISWPVLVYSCRSWGVSGALLLPSIVYLILAIFGKIQLTKILNKRETGIWSK